MRTNHTIEIEAEDAPAVFVPLLEVAAKIAVEPTTARRWIWKGQVTARRRDDSRGYEVNVATLPPKHRAAFATEVAAIVSGPREVADDEGPSRYRLARETVRERAEFRYEAVLSWEKARLGRPAGETLQAAERRWLHNFRRRHSGMKVSLRSVKAWAQALAAASGNIDALVDGNDGVKQRGARIPAPAKQMFRDEYLRAHRPNLRLIYDNVVTVAKVKGWGEMPSYHTFRRYGKSLPKMVRKLLRDCADTPRSVLPYVERDPNSLPAYHTIQSDIRVVRVPVRCEPGCETCTGKKARGHLPMWTAFVDIRSRRILGSDLSIETPTSDFILSLYRRIVDENGLNARVYLDNGSNYKKAFGQSLRRKGKTEWDGPTEEQLRARFVALGVEIIYAIPYNAQAKLIERMFRSFRHRFDEDFAGYRAKFSQTMELGLREARSATDRLPTLSELAYLLQLSIEEYNGGTPHTGSGMDGRTPNDVFYDPAIRLPRRDPDAAWALLFYQPVKRSPIVDRNGIRHEKRTYRLTSLRRQLEYYGEHVDFRFNPDDERHGIVLDRDTGEYLCDAVVSDKATYDTRDEITRELIARVFGDGRELQRMARAHVEGADERLREYRRAKIQYLIERSAQLEAVRQEQETGLLAAGGGSAVAIVPQFSAAARPQQVAAEASSDLTVSGILAVLDADEAASKPRLCVPTTRKSEHQGEGETPTRGRAEPRELSYAAIANLLGVSPLTLRRYREGIWPWPAGMKERFEKLENVRTTSAEEIDAELRMKPRLRTGEFSYGAIAKTLGVTSMTLHRYRTGKRLWPVGMKERFDELVRQRLA